MDRGPREPREIPFEDRYNGGRGRCIEAGQQTARQPVRGIFLHCASSVAQ